MASLNSLYETPFFPTLGALLLIWWPWVWAVKNGNRNDKEMSKPWLWLNILFTIVLIYLVLTYEN